MGTPFSCMWKKLFLEEILNSLVGNHLLIVDISTGLGALHHFDHLCISASIL